MSDRPVDHYVGAIEDDGRRDAVAAIVAAIRERIDPRFAETIQYGMPSWVVPHSEYPGGYHSKPAEPVPFMSVANQKGHISVYSMGMYGNADVLDWFDGEYAKLDLGKLNRGKGCVRFARPDRVPVELVGELAGKVSLDDYVAHYRTVDPRAS